MKEVAGINDDKVKELLAQLEANNGIDWARSKGNPRLVVEKSRGS